MRPHSRRTAYVRPLLAAALAAVLAAGATVATDGAEEDRGATTLAAATTTNRVTPGNFTGYGFDQCLAPTQDKMDRWLSHSPFLSVGIYISGASRGCRSQPNLTPTWVSTQLRKGWRLLPITLGPQASCSRDFPRYGNDPTINPDPTNGYAKAKAQGRLEADRAVAVAKGLGIVPGSTLFYDLEAFDITNTRCRESAIRFVHGWTMRLHAYEYVSGFYSSAGSGIKMLDDVRVNRPGAFRLPDYLWVARWDGRANTTVDTQYLRSDGWVPHRRVKQYQGGHDETWGGVTINIDRNFLDVGKGSYAAPETHCGGIDVDHTAYLTLTPYIRHKAQVQTLQCFLKEQGAWEYGLKGYFGAKLAEAVTAWKVAHGFKANATWSRAQWVSLMSQGPRSIVKYGSAGAGVRRLQRALVANGYGVRIDGVFGPSTDSALRSWQDRVGIARSGVAAPNVWNRLQAGR